MSAFDEAAALRYYPFDGDFGAPGDRTLSDKIVTARAEGACHMCAEKIQPGQRTRRMSAMFDGELHSYRWCEQCCAAMAKSWTDEGRDLDARFRLRKELGQ